MQNFILKYTPKQSDSAIPAKKGIYAASNKTAVGYLLILAIEEILTEKENVSTKTSGFFSN